MIETTIRPAKFEDLPAIEALRRADGDALGFVPKAKYEHIVLRTSDRGRDRWKYEWLVVAEDNGEITGYFLAGFHRDGTAPARPVRRFRSAFGNDRRKCR